MLDPNTVGDDIAAFVKNNRPQAGFPVTDAQLKVLWEGIMGIIYTDLKTNTQVFPGTFVAPPGGGPVTGLGGPLE